METAKAAAAVAGVVVRVGSAVDWEEDEEGAVRSRPSSTA